MSVRSKREKKSSREKTGGGYALSERGAILPPLAPFSERGKRRGEKPKQKNKISPFSERAETPFSSSLFSSSRRHAGQHRPPPGHWPLLHRQQWKPPQRRPRRRGGLDPVEFFELDDVDQPVVVVVVSLPFDRHGHPESPRRQDPGAAGRRAQKERALDAKRVRERGKRELSLLATTKEGRKKKLSAPFLSFCRSSPYQTRSWTPSFARD